MNGSQWLSDFKPKEMEERLNKLGNLILLNENNNAKFGNFDFQEKRQRYIESDIEPFRHSLKVMNSNNSWRAEDIDRNQLDIVIDKLCKHYCKEGSCSEKLFKKSYLPRKGISIS